MGNPDYQWGDLIAFVSGLREDSAFVREVLGEDETWTRTDDLLAIVADRLAIIHYALTARKGDDPPPLLSRFANGGRDPSSDRVEDLAELAERNASGAYTAEVTSVEETARRLGWTISAT